MELRLGAVANGRRGASAATAPMSQNSPRTPVGIVGRSSRWLLFSGSLGIALLIVAHPLFGALAAVSGCLFVLGLVGQRAVLAPVIISPPARDAAHRSIESPPR